MFDTQKPIEETRKEDEKQKTNYRPVLFNQKNSGGHLKETAVVYGNVPDDPTVDYDVTFCSQGTYSSFLLFTQIVSLGVYA